MGKNQKNHQNVLEIVPNFGKNEQGRSMVEMLGVLAIIGVLSIGAISGYRYAMNKYRANQTVNELNLLSHQVAIAMMSKNGLSGALTLGESYDANKKLTSSGYNFAYGCGDSGVDTECSGQNAFHFEVKDVSEGVCKELETMGEHLQYLESLAINAGSGCQSGNENSVNFVFASDDFMSEEKLSPKDVEYCNGHGKYDLETGICVCKEGFIGYFCAKDKTCSGNGTYIKEWSDWEDSGGICNCLHGYTGASCQTPVCNGHGIKGSTSAPRDGECICEGIYNGPNCECGEGEQWDGLQCTTTCPEDGCVIKECVKNEDCDSGQYCGKTYNDRKALCRSVDADSIKADQYVASKVRIDWPSANRFCEAQGKSLITVDDLDCKHTFCKSGCDSSDMGYCYNKNSDTVNVRDRLGTRVAAWSPTVFDLKKKFDEREGLSYFFWTGTEYSGSRKYGVLFATGEVHTLYDYDGFNAVCQ